MGVERLDESKASPVFYLWAAVFVILYAALAFYCSPAYSAACAPLPTCAEPPVPPCGTPTPVIAWDYLEPPTPESTKGVRVYWKHPEDAAWRGSLDLPSWPGDADSDPVWPGLTTWFPAQRLVPANEVNVEIEVVAKAYSATNVEGAPSNVVTYCAPPIWTGGPYL